MGHMMLACVPEDGEGNNIRKELLKQLKEMQGGDRDIVKLVGTTDPRDIPLSDIEKLYGNDDALLFWNDLFFYVKRGDSRVVPLEYRVLDEQVEPFERLITSLRHMQANTARKSDDEEHALIAATLGRTLSRKGIHYEALDMYTNVVKINGVANPGDIDFHELARLFDNEDAILFWNDGFYYANKADSSVTPISPTLTTDNEGAFVAFKASFTSMPANSARQASPSERALIKSALFPQGLSRKTIHYCDSHYDFGVIDALQTYIDRFDDLDWPRRDALWINQVAKAQMGMPANALQHYCDPDEAFFPLPDFKAEAFRRDDYFFKLPNSRVNLFSGASLDSGLGFQFGLLRVPWVAATGRGRPRSDRCFFRADLNALLGLYKVRTDDAKQLQDNLCRSLELAPIGPTGARGPS